VKKQKSVGDDANTTTPEAPAGLSWRSCRLWAHYAGEQEAGRLALLEEALRALDRAEQAREIVERDGLVLSGGKMPHAHPAVRVEHQARAEFVRIWSHLGLGHGGVVALGDF